MFDEDEVDKYVRTGVLDITDLSDVTIEVDFADSVSSEEEGIHADFIFYPL